VGHEFRDEQDHIHALYGLCELGAREAIITHAEGCYALIGRNHERCLCSVRAEPLEPVSAIGAGDVFVAGYLAARYSGQSDRDCLRFAVACGAESTQHFGAGVLDPRSVERIANEVSITELERPAAVDARA
jgi:1-phosphofructokinase/tagatose 6-phosphate kinase